MTLNLSCPWLVRLSLPSPHIVTLNSFTFSRSLHCSNSVVFDSFSRSLKLNASLKESGSAASAETPVSELLDGDFLVKISGAQDSNDVLSMIADKSRRSEGVVSVADCCLIISAALERNNPELALSVLYAMRSSVDQASVNQNGPYLGRWMWSRPDVHVYALLIQGLAASLRVSDAIKMIQNICRVGLSPGEEVPFGKVVRCPSCMVAVAVAQPQNGIQIVSCAQCCYQYELISGDIISIQSEEIRIYSCRTQHGCSSMEKGTQIFETNETKCPCCCSLHSGGNTIWSCTYTQVCHRNSRSPSTTGRKGDNCFGISS